MSDQEDTKIEAIMRRGAQWYGHFCILTEEILDSWAVDARTTLPKNKYGLAIELMENSPFFWGNDPDFDPRDSQHRDYLAHWCQRWLDKQRLIS